MITASVSHEIRSKCPHYYLGFITCNVINNECDDNLWKLINKEIHNVKRTLTNETIKAITPINYTRIAYKNCGKDPNRYRPSGEQLLRRILKHGNLYKISTLVDLVNLVSIKYGYSIGGFDAGKIKGNIEFGIGQQGEEYHGIGRDLFNITGMPVWRDEIGGIGTPTSDEERTKLSLETTSFLMIINAFSGIEKLHETMDYSISLLEKFVQATNIQKRIIQ